VIEALVLGVLADVLLAVVAGSLNILLCRAKPPSPLSGVLLVLFFVDSGPSERLQHCVKHRVRKQTQTISMRWS
jgi:hypothetical protein